MTIQRLSRSDNSVHLRCYPLLALLFTALALYHIGAIIASVTSGQRPFSTGVAVAISILIAFTLFANLLAGEFAVCTFDREQQSIALRRYSLKGVYRADRPLRDLESINVLVVRGAYCQISLLLRSGERLPLTSSYILLLRMRNMTTLANALNIALVAERQKR